MGPYFMSARDIIKWGSLIILGAHEYYCWTRAVVPLAVALSPRNSGDYINVSREKCPYCAWHNPNTTATIDLWIYPGCSPRKIQFTKEGKEATVRKASYS